MHTGVLQCFLGRVVVIEDIEDLVPQLGEDTVTAVHIDPVIRHPVVPLCAPVTWNLFRALRNGLFPH
ncbi:hypothetical protein GCM10009791_19840 [Citricoccus zhacaiensis]